MELSKRELELIDDLLLNRIATTYCRRNITVIPTGKKWMNAKF